MTDYRKLVEEWRSVPAYADFTGKEIWEMADVLEACDRERQEVQKLLNDVLKWREEAEAELEAAQRYRDALEQIASGATLLSTPGVLDRSFSGRTAQEQKRIARAALAAGDISKRPPLFTGGVMHQGSYERGYDAARLEMKKKGDLSENAAKAIITMHKELVLLRKIAQATYTASEIVDREVVADSELSQYWQDNVVPLLKEWEVEYGK